ncbi:MAG: UDP-N-acetylmuramate dehydrogenase [Rhodospirillaceae bacterium]|nr:UDP-N-acetylmuramate dehydrogenase [Rhodospirillaceae bacterium]MBT4490394.1 UDP-N-acetylmuramate dehydrogenase [Rhodospirillaceae bacterium]MBT5194627.1 UDP-N-acetylmuramate dehydrogenase [Rhodospirillaceae bacterium]MBT5895559.1 UDP-N-acetylmuramate dehydrogenase [Rhodospirillaceae bacterium]MBT6429474.1 UDP-N-acetylmuramate dehydrogenase [Rhodospirillaceae bacterium]
MTAHKHDRSLLSRLPVVRGRYVENVDLSGCTWFRVGGPADVVYRPADAGDLAAFLKQCPQEIPRTVLGLGSNLLIRDGGVRGVVIRLDRAFNQIEIDGDYVTVGAGVLDVNLARVCRDGGLVGFEFMRGIPGTVGGGLRMNGGAYGRAFRDVLVWAEVVDGAGIMHRAVLDELDLSYRHCGAPEDWIFTAAQFRGKQGGQDEITARMREVSQARKESQPVNTRTGGSTFKNPDSDNPDSPKAWELIDRAGCRGLVRGGAMVSELHCNFLINMGDATAADLEALGEEVRRRVEADSGIMLQWEIRRIGEHGPDGALTSIAEVAP